MSPADEWNALAVNLHDAAALLYKQADAMRDRAWRAEDRARDLRTEEMAESS